MKVKVRVEYSMIKVTIIHDGNLDVVKMDFVRLSVKCTVYQNSSTCTCNNTMFLYSLYKLQKVAGMSLVHFT